MRTQTVTPDVIQRIVADVWGVTVDEIACRCEHPRTPTFVEARTVSMAFCEALARPGSNRMITLAHGRTDASTVIHAVKRAADLCEVDRSFREKTKDAARELIKLIINNTKNEEK